MTHQLSEQLSVLDRHTEASHPRQITISELGHRLHIYGQEYDLVATISGEITDMSTRCWESTYFILHKLSNVWSPVTITYCLILYTQRDYLNFNIVYFGVTI